MGVHSCEAAGQMPHTRDDQHATARSTCRKNRKEAENHSGCPADNCCRVENVLSNSVDIEAVALPVELVLQSISD
jgi:hypothetical protein